MGKAIIGGGIVGILLGILFVGWWFNYMAPKRATQMDAKACFNAKGYTALDRNSKPAWESCLDAAEQKHSTKTLKVVGY